MSDSYDDYLDQLHNDADAGERKQFDWDDGNLDHLSHGVSREEAEEALLDPRRVGSGTYNSANETRWAAIGATEDGRVLYVVYTTRGQQVRVITAYDASQSDRRRYRRR